MIGSALLKRLVKPYIESLLVALLLLLLGVALLERVERDDVSVERKEEEEEVLVVGMFLVPIKIFEFASPIDFERRVNRELNARDVAEVERSMVE